MPDSLARYYVYEMEQRVRTLLDATTQTLDSNGNAIAVLQSDFNISNQDIDNQLNTSMMALYMEGLNEHEDCFVQTVFMDVLKSQLDYSFPANMLQLRWMRTKRHDLAPPTSVLPGGSVPSTAARPSDYKPMYEVYDPQDLAMSVGYYKGPTWQRNGSAFKLNEFPLYDNPGGIMMQVVVLPPILPVTTPAMFTSGGIGNPAVIKGPFPQIVQEALIYDAAVILGDSKSRSLPTNIQQLRQEWHQRFMKAIINAEANPSVNFTSGRLIGDNYAGRGLSAYSGQGRQEWT